jgi:hypothetical protein
LGTTAVEVELVTALTLHAEPELAIHAVQLHYGAYAPAGIFRAGQTVQVPGLEWATLKVADLDD